MIGRPLDFGRILGSLGQGLMAAGSPQGWSAFGPAFAQGQQMYDQRAQSQQLQQLREMQLAQSQQQIDQDALANSEAAAAKKQWADYIASQEGLMMPPRPGAPGMGGEWTPDQLQILKLLPAEQGLGVVAERKLAKPEADEWKLETFKEGGQEVTAWVNPRTQERRDVASGPAWAPHVPAQGDGIWSPYVDPKSGRTGQKNSKTGKIDWDPGNTMMVQTGVDPNGNPIYDMVSTSAGKPPSESNIQAGIRGTLVESSINNIRQIANDIGAKISPLRMAAADTMGENGPMGAYGANLLRTDDEKKYSAAISKGVEGLVAAITGAGVAKDQFPRIQNLIPGPTDSPEVVNWKLDQLGPVLDVLLAGSGPLALAGDKKPIINGITPDTPAAPKAPADMTDDELMKALGQ